MKFILKIWKDPVWSKVISVGILALLAFVWKAFSPEKFQSVMTFQLQLWILLIFLFLVIILSTWFNNRKKKQPFIYTDAAKKHDENAFKPVQRSSGDIFIMWCKTHDINEDFTDQITGELREAIEANNMVELEFMHPDVEALRKSYVASMKKLQLLLKQHLVLNTTTGYMTLKAPPLFDINYKPQTLIDLLKRLQQEIYQYYDEMVRVYKREQSK